jgi:iron(II)-dependent oxidoreductase
VQESTAPDIDSPAMRQAGRDGLSLALIDARNHTLRLLAAHEAAVTQAAPAPAATGHAPAVWLAGHAGWFAEHWIARNTLRAQGSACPHQPPRLASIEPHADIWWAQEPSQVPGPLGLPGFRGHARLAAGNPGDHAGVAGKDAGKRRRPLFLPSGAVHEDQLGERLVTLAQTLGVPLGSPEAQTAAARDPLVVPAARWSLGSAPGGFVFDNEKWAHAVAVPEFEIDAQPVSWSQYIEFVDDGGYDRPELWHTDGWAWLQAQDATGGRRGPRHVDQIGVARFGGAGAVLQMRFGQPVRVAGHHPVTHAAGGRPMPGAAGPAGACPTRPSGSWPRMSRCAAGFAGARCTNGPPAASSPIRAFRPIRGRTIRCRTSGGRGCNAALRGRRAHA